MSLLTNLISHWALEEATGTRVDSPGSNDLAETGTVGQGVGKIGNAADFPGVIGNYLSVANNASLQTGDIDFTVAGWVKFETITGLMGIYSRDNTTTIREMIVYKNLTHQPTFLVFNAANSVVGNVSASAVTAGTWYFIVAWHDSVANTANLQVNNGTPVSAATTGTPAVKVIESRVGAFGNDTSFLDGLIDESSFWKRVLTADERTFLYNGGNGARFVAGTGFVPVGHSKQHKWFRP